MVSISRRHWAAGGGRRPLRARATLALRTVDSADVNDISGGVAGWWETYPNLEGIVQPWTISSGSVAADLGSWPDNLGVTVVANAVRATTDNTRHYCYDAAIDNGASTWCDIPLVGTMQGAQAWVRVWAGAEWANVNLTTGALGNVSGATVTATVAAGSATVAFRGVIARDIRLELLEPALGDDATATPAVYVGNTNDGINVTSCAYRQDRVSAIADLSRVGGGGGALRGGNAVNATVTTQLLYQSNFASVAGRAAPFQEVGRSTYLVAAHADVLALFNTADSAHVMFGVRTLYTSATSGRLWSCTVGIDQLYRNGNNIVYSRGTTTRTFNNAAIPLLDTPGTFAFISLPDGSTELYVNGVSYGAQAATGEALATITGLRLGVVSANASSVFPATAIRGVFAGLNAAQAYAAIRPALQAMAARWGGLPA